MAKIISKFGEEQLVMMNYACGFNQSETGKYFEWIIIFIQKMRGDILIVLQAFNSVRRFVNIWIYIL